MVTDHKPLLLIFNTKATVPSIATVRMQRWAMFLSAYQYIIEYRSGKSHANADCLSRLPLQGSKESQDPSTLFQVSFVDKLPVTAVDIARETTTGISICNGKMATQSTRRKTQTLLSAKRPTSNRSWLFIVGIKSDNPNPPASSFIEGCWLPP